MSTWLYPTYFRELEKSYAVQKFGKALFFPKSIILDREEYTIQKTTYKTIVYYETRCKFLMPEWYIKKYKILHWDNIHMASGKTYEQHMIDKFPGYEDFLKTN